jgi:cyclophilin family peptidyl-prolyl cis-trans isomerase
MGYYEGIAFHRVIKDFMVQAGDPVTKTGLAPEQSDTLFTYTLPAEFRPEYFHKKGALAAAREGNNVNPEMRSSGTQFYIVQGTRFTDEELTTTERRINNNIKQSFFNKFMHEISDSALKKGVQLPESEIQEKASVKMFDFLASAIDFKYSEDQKNIYKTIGGVARLDGTYTVFGEVVEGLEIIDKIASVPTNNNDRPLSDVRIIKMKIVSK